tara:strand:+ start:3490 stop:6393 length:2904 start_codon:yes stop_codon:yes gene_type:complete
MENNYQIKRRRKLIESSIPLDAINEASSREKSIRHSHPSTLHLWWARRPLASARAILFCQLVDDPSDIKEEFPTVEEQDSERERIFSLIKEFVIWENSNNKILFKKVKDKIQESWIRCCKDNADHPQANQLFDPENIPSFHDPFAGGGSIPLEAQRLGLSSFASDLNPVAVLINKCILEIPSHFSEKCPVSKNLNKKGLFNDSSDSRGSTGLAEDINFYGQMIKKKAEEKIGDLYPRIQITKEMVIKRPDLAIYEGQKLKIISCQWARAIKSCNPTFSHVDVPLATTFYLSTKKGKEAYIQPIIKGDHYIFEVKIGRPENDSQVKLGTSAGKRSAFRCIMSGSPIPYEYIRDEGAKGNITFCLMALVADGKKGRIFLSPTPEYLSLIKHDSPKWIPDLELANNPRDLATTKYGMKTFDSLFTNRQLIALSTLSSEINGIQKKIEQDALNSGFSNDKISLQNNGRGAKAYSEAIVVYLSLALSRLTNTINALSVWSTSREQSVNLFSRQTIRMAWDFPEVNPFSGAAGDYGKTINSMSKTVKNFLSNNAFATQADAQNQKISNNKIISTDPPYYDNICYADLSDFFYVWLRSSLRNIYPKLFSTISTPKQEELVANQFLHDNKKNAELFFMDGMTKVMTNLSSQSHPCYPITIYYAFKQSETNVNSGTSSTGWETFLTSLINSDLCIKGTWPIRTERPTGVKKGTNSLASSIVLVCEKRKSNNSILRNDFKRKLTKDLPLSIQKLAKGNIAPVDLAQAVIGPGMAIYSSVKSILNPDDTKMSVRQALIEINNVVDDYLSQNEGELDEDSRFAVTFFESFGYTEREFGDAEGLAKARNVSVEGIVKAGILNSVGGKVNLITREDLPEDWDPLQDDRLCIWEATQHLIKRLEIKGEHEAAELLNKLKRITSLGDISSRCKSLAYRLFIHCEKNNYAEEALAYNSLIIAWPELEQITAQNHKETTIQTKLV